MARILKKPTLQWFCWHEVIYTFTTPSHHLPDHLAKDFNSQLHSNFVSDILAAC